MPRALARSPVRSWWAQLLLVLAMGTAWGLYCWLGDNIVVMLFGLRGDPGALRSVLMFPVAAANLGGPWLILAFLVGALTSSLLRGPLYGALTLAAAVLVYYGTYHATNLIDPGSYDPRYFFPGGAAWLVLASLAGTAFGATGAGWRTGRPWLRVPAVVLLSGALLGESLFILGQQYGYGMETLIPLAEALLALALPVLLLPRWRQTILGVTVALGMAVVGTGALAFLDEFLRVNFRA